MKKHIAEDIDFRSQLGVLAIPIALQHFMQAAVGAGDAAMLGFVSQDTLSAVALANQIRFVLDLFFGAIVGGISVMVPQYWGRKSPAAVYRIYCLSIRYILIISVLFSLAAVLAPELLMRIFTFERSLISIGADYLRIAGISYFFTGLSQCCHCVLKSIGRTERAVAVSGFCLVLDAVLNAVFILGLFGMPAMGAAGAAWTTVITHLLEAILIGYLLYWVPEWQDIVFPSEKLKREFWHYTLPVLINSMVWGLGTTSCSIIVGHLGSDATAANSIAAVIKELVSCLHYSIQTGGGIILGNHLGAGRLDTAKTYGGKLSKASIFCGLISALLVLLCTPIITALLKLTDTAQYYLEGILLICAFYMIGRSINNVVVCGVFHAGGDTVFDAVSVALSMWLFVIPLSCAAAFWWKWSVWAVIFIIHLDEVIKLPWVYRHYKQYKWVRCITMNDSAEKRSLIRKEVSKQ